MFRRRVFMFTIPTTIGEHKFDVDTLLVQSVEKHPLPVWEVVRRSVVMYQPSETVTLSPEHFRRFTVEL